MTVFAKPVSIKIARGASTHVIATTLAKAGIIRYASLFTAYVLSRGLEGKLHAGEFHIETPATYPLIVARLTKPAMMIKVTIPEGISLKKLAQILDKAGLAERDDALTYFQTKKAAHITAFPFLDEVKGTSLEGLLYPETYLFAKGVPLSSITTAMLRLFEQRLLPLWKQYQPKSKPIFSTMKDALAIASLVEKEAYLREEMPLIASVFHNRLKKGMRLASDPTVLYALGEPPNKAVVYYKDLTVDSPYNTYKYTGIPPGPISNVSQAALQATLSPKRTPYLFFVADTHGKHHFNVTYRAHHRTHMTIKKGRI